MLESHTAGLQKSIDRARAQAHTAFRRAQTDLARLKKEREKQNEANCEVAASESAPEQNEPNSVPESVPGQNEANSPATSLELPENSVAPLPDPETKRTQFREPLRVAA